MKFQISIFFCMVSSFIVAQNFTPMPPGFNYQVRTVFADSSTGNVYAGGYFWQYGNGEPAHAIACWNGIEWDSLQSGVNDAGGVFSIVRYRDTICVGGVFSLIGGMLSRGMAKWDGSNWIYGGNFVTGAYGGVRRLFVDDNNLYLLGYLDHANGMICNLIARYDGSAWSAFPVLDNSGNGFLTCAAIYQGELYVGGNFDPGGQKNDIAKFDGTNWVSVGGGLSGGSSELADMVVYQNKLYVSGYFLSSNGDPGNMIATWDGSNWGQVGGGALYSTIFDMEIVDNDLYVAGSIDQVGSLPVTGIAKWDGNNWSGLGAIFNNYPGTMSHIGNDLYIGGGFRTIDGDTNLFITKYSIPVGISDVPHSNAYTLTNFPNPATYYTEIRIPENMQHDSNVQLFIYEINGRLVESKSIERDINKIQLDLYKYNDGLYCYKLKSNSTSGLVGKLTVVH